MLGKVLPNRILDPSSDISMGIFEVSGCRMPDNQIDSGAALLSCCQGNQIHRLDHFDKMTTCRAALLSIGLSGLYYILQVGCLRI